MTSNHPLAEQPPADGASTPESSSRPSGPSTTLRTVLLVVGSIILVVIIVATVFRVTASLNREDTSGTFAVDQQFDSIELRASAADVQIDYRAVSKPELRFDQGGSNLRFEHSVSGGTLQLAVKSPGWGWWGFGSWGQRGATLLVVLPESMQGEEVALTLDSTAGNMEVFGEFGSIRLESTAGDVQLRGGATEIDITTTAGNVELRDFAVTGSLRSESTAGDVSFQFRGLPERMDVQSTAGNVDVELPRGRYRIDTDTTAGSVTQNLSSDADASRVYRFETTAGNITLDER